MTFDMTTKLSELSDAELEQISGGLFGPIVAVWNSIQALSAQGPAPGIGDDGVDDVMLSKY